MKHSGRNRERTHSLHTVIITRTHLTILYSVSALIETHRNTVTVTYTRQMSARVLRSWQVSATHHRRFSPSMQQTPPKRGSYSSTTDGEFKDCEDTWSWMTASGSYSLMCPVFCDCEQAKKRHTKPRFFSRMEQQINRKSSSVMRHNETLVMQLHQVILMSWAVVDFWRRQTTTQS